MYFYGFSKKKKPNPLNQKIGVEDSNPLSENMK